MQLTFRIYKRRDKNVCRKTYRRRRSCHLVATNISSEILEFAGSRIFSCRHSNDRHSLPSWSKVLSTEKCCCHRLSHFTRLRQFTRLSQLARLSQLTSLSQLTGLNQFTMLTIREAERIHWRVLLWPFMHVSQFRHSRPFMHLSPCMQSGQFMRSSPLMHSGQFMHLSPFIHTSPILHSNSRVQAKSCTQVHK